jgi:hypothetical protein
LAKADSIFINSFLAIENREAWEQGPGTNFRGAASIWSPLQVSKHTLLRLISNSQQALNKEDFAFILSMFRLRDEHLKKHGALQTPAAIYRPSIFKVRDNWNCYDEITSMIGDNELANWHRAYFILPWLGSFVLLILQADTKTFSIVAVTQTADAKRYTSSVTYETFMRSNGPLLAAGWKRGAIGPISDLLCALDTINILEIKHAGLFYVYVIYFLLVDVPVYFDAKHPNLRENLAYYCIKGNMPF